MPSSDHSTSSDRKLLPWAVVGFLLVVIAVVYDQTLRFGFLDYDDELFVTGCREVRAGLTGNSIAWAFTSGPLGEWYPLSMLSHMLDCQLFGLNPWGHHLTNVLLHAATSIGLFFVWRSMTGELWPSAFVATVFAIHPQHVESVAWIAERRDVLSGLFFVLTLAAYVGYVHHGRTVGRYALVAAALSLGLMSKAMLVTVPPLLLLLDYWPLGRFGSAADLPESDSAHPRQSFGWLALEKLPLVAIALADCAMTLTTHARLSSSLAWSERFAGAVVALVAYLIQFFYPADLALAYPFPIGGYAGWEVAGAVVILAGISGAAVFQWRQRPYLLVGWFWYVGMLVPVLGLVQVADQARADRYMYLPSIGLCVAVAWGATRLAERLHVSRLLLGTGAALAIGLLVIWAERQTSYWHDGLSLWEHSLATTLDNAEAEQSLGLVLVKAGRLDEAVEHYRRAERLRRDAPLLNNLAAALRQQGKLDEAGAVVQEAIQLEPGYAQSYATFGFVLELQGKSAEAAKQYLRAAELDGSSPLPHFQLANLLVKEGRFDEAIVHFRQVVALDPGNLTAYIGLAIALAQVGQFDQAMAECRNALKVEPHNATARQMLDMLRDLKARAAAL